MTETVRILAATGGLGFAPPNPTRSFYPGLERRPSAIIADAGSADIGPLFLGADIPYNEHEWEELDFERLLEGAARLGIPLVVGSCGGYGTDRAVESYAEIVDAVARRQGRSFDTALIFAEKSHDWLLSLLDGIPAPPALGPGLPDLTSQGVEASDRLVAVMGFQPIVAALEAGAQVVLAGRACDDALFAAAAIAQGAPTATALLAGKLLENSSLVAEPFVLRETVIADVGAAEVVLEPMLPEQRCTRTSVAAELMYERRTPFEQAGPGGLLDLYDVGIEEVDERRVSVRGARYRRLPPALKIEGAGLAGYRSVCIAGCRDPRMIGALDPILNRIQAEVTASGSAIAVNVFGRDAVMGPLEPIRVPAHEVGIVVETLAGSQAEANRACLLAKRLLFSASYPGQKQTGGSIMSLIDEFLEAGASYRWTVNHVVPVPDLVEPFRIERRILGAAA